MAVELVDLSSDLQAISCLSQKNNENPGCLVKEQAEGPWRRRENLPFES